MEKFKVTFVHTQKISYDAFIEANNEEEAENICINDPYYFVEDLAGEIIEGLEFNIISIEKMQ